MLRIGILLPPSQFPGCLTQHPEDNKNVICEQKFDHHLKKKRLFYLISSLSCLSHQLSVLHRTEAGGSKSKSNVHPSRSQTLNFQLGDPQAGEQPAPVGEIITYSLLRPESQSQPSCLNGFPSFCESDPRSGHDRQKAFGSTSSSPQIAVFQVSLLVTHSLLSRLFSAPRLGNLLHKVLLLGKCL